MCVKCFCIRFYTGKYLMRDRHRHPFKYTIYIYIIVVSEPGNWFLLLIFFFICFYYHLVRKQIKYRKILISPLRRVFLINVFCIYIHKYQFLYKKTEICMSHFTENLRSIKNSFLNLIF